MVITDSANVTLRDSSGTNTGGARHTGLGAAVSIAVRSGSVNIQGGTYSPNVTRAERCYGSVGSAAVSLKTPKTMAETVPFITQAAPWRVCWQTARPFPTRRTAANF